MSVDDIKKYYKEDHFTFLVVEANDLYFGFDLSIVEEYEIDVKIVTQSYWPQLRRAPIKFGWFIKLYNINVKVLYKQADMALMLRQVCF